MIRLRAATASDLARVHELLEAARLPTDGLGDQFPDAYVVAESDGRVVAAAGIERHGTWGLLRSVVVAADRRGTGIGERLVRERLDWARQSRLDAVYALTTTAADYFPRLGFSAAPRDGAPEELKASREFASVCPSSAICLRIDVPNFDNAAVPR